MVSVTVFVIGLGLPMAIVSGGDAPTPYFSQNGLEQMSGFSLGDLRLALKGTILGGNGKGFGLAIAADLTFPTSTARNFAGYVLVTGMPRIILDWSVDG